MRSTEICHQATCEIRLRRREGRLRKYAFALISFPLFFTLGEGRLAADEVTKWNEIAGRAAFASGLHDNPLFTSRVYAMTHAAVHDALNAIDRRYRPYVLDRPVTPGASSEAAVVAAAHHVLVNQYSLLTAFGFPSQQPILDAAYDSSLALIPDGPAKTAGLEVGNSAATAILALRAHDGWNTKTVLDFNFPQGTAPGEYRFTPPFNFAFLPAWGTLPPFVLNKSSQFRPGPPYKINSRRYTEDFNEVKSLGGDGQTTLSARTADQTQIALFWLESSPLGWNRIARTVSVARGLDLWENGRLFGLLNLALADGYIAVFDAKYHYNYWRPITAIREADTDGNPDTVGDPNWRSLVDAPAVPDYDSGHAVQGGAAAQVLLRFFDTDNIAFTTCSTTIPAGSTCNDASPAWRFFTSFSDAAEENGLSRILIGFHFRKAVTEGIEHGRKIADYAFNHFLRPAHGAPVKPVSIDPVGRTTTSRPAPATQ